MSFMKKGKREDARKQRAEIRTQLASKLHRIPLLAGTAYQLADVSKDITINNIDSYLSSLGSKEEFDEFEKRLIIGEYNRVLKHKQNEQGDKHN